MAVVYRALDEPLGREVAVKVLHAHLAGQPESRARLQREARAVAQLRHANILEIFAYSGIDSPDSYLVTEFIHGPTLKAFVAEHPPAFPEIGVMIACEIAAALSCAHQLGIIHRDVKPENVMVRRDGTVVLCDFGIAQVVDKERMTATGQLLGSPAYMAPEHIEGKPLDCRTDIFSLGVLLYQLVCGDLPFRGKNPHETLKKITDGHFAPPDEVAPQCSSRLSRIIGRALHRDPAGRYPRASDLRGEMMEYLRDAGIKDPREELAAYFKDPQGWQERFRPRLVQALVDSGAQRKAQGKTAAALALWGRAQQLAPENAEVASFLRGAARRRSLRRTALGVLGALLLVLGGLGVHRAARQRPPEAPPPPVSAIATAAPSAPPAPAGQRPPGPVPETPDLRPKEAPAVAVRPPAPAPAPVARREAAPARKKPPGPPRIVRLEPWPKSVQVSLNGKDLGSYGTDVRTIELPEGESDVQFENPACYTEHVHIGADADPGEIRVRLRWKPALLMVRSQPPGPREADVVVDGRIVGRTAQVLALPIRSDDGRGTAEVKISAPGHGTVTRTVDVRANQLATIEVLLQPI